MKTIFTILLFFVQTSQPADTIRMPGGMIKKSLLERTQKFNKERTNAADPFSDALIEEYLDIVKENIFQKAQSNYKLNEQESKELNEWLQNLKDKSIKFQKEHQSEYRQITKEGKIIAEKYKKSTGQEKIELKIKGTENLKKFWALQKSLPLRSDNVKNVLESRLPLDRAMGYKIRTEDDWSKLLNAFIKRYNLSDSQIAQTHSVLREMRIRYRLENATPDLFEKLTSEMVRKWETLLTRDQLRTYDNSISSKPS